MTFHNNAQLNILVSKRNGDAVPFQPEKISTAITKAILAVEGQSASGSSRVHGVVSNITNDIVSRFRRLMPDGGIINIEDIQDQVELGLMRQGLQQIARAYVLYREERARKRVPDISVDKSKSEETLTVKLENGQLSEHPLSRIKQDIVDACAGLSDVEPEHIFDLAINNLYDGMNQHDIVSALIMTARSMIEVEPNYSFVCAQLLNQSLQNIIAEQFSITPSNDNFYLETFSKTIQFGVDKELLNSELLSYDLEQLAIAIKPERDRQFTYLGLQTLFDRYFLHWQQRRFEAPQSFFMRVAMGLALKEERREERAIEFYNVLSSFNYMCSTPTLFNSGTCRSQLSSCYLTTVDDDLSSIYQAVADNAQLSKWAGGLGNDWTPVRSLGAHINGTNGQSQGVIPFLKVVNDSAVAVNQGGKRKGAVCAYLESWHLDIEDFLELRKNTGDERRRTHDMNTANWIPDLFIKRVINDEIWTLFSPNDVPDLHELYGREFEKRYFVYERKADQGEIKLVKQIPAKQLWQKMLSMLFETGHPWITFKDACNIRSPQQHTGVVHSSNLCTEITLNTNENEIAVCNLGSINLSQHIKDDGIDQLKLQQTIRTAVRMLDNVIDINFYPVEKARNANLKHRPVGLGIMGFQDALYQLNIPYASVDAVHFSDSSMEIISYFAIEASALLAAERGKYESYEGSLWHKNIFPVDSLEKLQDERGDSYCSFDMTAQLDWRPLRDLVRKNGMRNSNVMAIAPTATISNIVGVSQSIEPTYQNLFVKSNLSGEFVVANHHLVKTLKKHKLWDSVMANDLKYFDGSVQSISRVPQEIKNLFLNAFEIDPRWLVESAARRQKWIDQAQSLNLYMSEPSGKKLDNLYKMAWSRGLKTTYYLRSLGATHSEKSEGHKGTIASSNYCAESASDEMVNVCNINDPECEACQ
ncbi:ribonucleoside-diphosphate reductase subunit alpha [Pleionea sediminis]|uniref:ribonucleoside-diphosphate reductase subunit alpha n=1 Tax=Pleionea sediminis TaxID=2569479 RepID=UPI0011855E79|nr:ribonucleoside-diphosphate reductase subunit alpha [Pleionea sediminis]